MGHGFDLHGGTAPSAPGWPGALVLAGLLLLYLATFPHNLTEGEDALWYVERVARGAWQWHPNHLLVEPLAWLARAGLARAGFELPALAVMQGLSLAAGLAALALIWRLTARLAGGLLAPLGAALATGFSFAFWLYAMMPDTYALPLPFALAGISALQRVGEEMIAGRPAPLRRTLWAALMVALAVLFHQQYLFLALAGALALLLWSAGLPAGRRAAGLGHALAFALVLAGLVLAAYLAVALLALGLRAPGEILLWARGLARGGLWTPFGALAPLKSLLGLGTAIWSPVFLFASDRFVALAERVFAGRLFVEETFLARTGLALGFWPLLGLTALSLAGFLALLWRALGGLLRGGDGRGLSLLLLLFFLTGFAAITAWEPTNKEFWIATLPALFMLVFVNAGRAPLRSALFLVPLLAANLLGAMLGFARPESDYWYMQNRWLIEDTAAGDLVIDRCGYICEGYLRLFSPARYPDREADRQARAAPPHLPASRPGGGRVLVTSRALEAGADPPGRLVLRDRRMGLSVFELFGEESR